MIVFSSPISAMTVATMIMAMMFFMAISMTFLMISMMLMTIAMMFLFIAMMLIAVMLLMMSIAMMAIMFFLADLIANHDMNTDSIYLFVSGLNFKVQKKCNFISAIQKIIGTENLILLVKILLFNAYHDLSLCLTVLGT